MNIECDDKIEFDEDIYDMTLETLKCLLSTISTCTDCSGCNGTIAALDRLIEEKEQNRSYT